MILAEPPRTAVSGAARVMVCDDSVIMRAAIARALEGDPGVPVVARTADGVQALAELRCQPIDVLVLDIEMPVMDGLTALPLLLRAAPLLRVVMASTLTTRGAKVTLQALRLGAADYIAKPSVMAGQTAELFRRELLGKVAILTGMESDGLDGTRRVVEAGGTAIAQDEPSSVVWVMPGAIAHAGLCHAVLPLNAIAPRLLELLRRARP